MSVCLIRPRFTNVLYIRGTSWLILEADNHSSYAVVVCVNIVSSLTRLEKGRLQYMEFYSFFFFFHLCLNLYLFKITLILYLFISSYSCTTSSC